MRAGDAYAAFERAGVTFWTGVPDSLLAPFLCALEKQVPAGRHVLAANEGGAVAIAGGHHLATGEIAGVYLQNSGLGNAVNPLVSLADPAVYALPMVLVIGWRGRPGTVDEPQHRRQGEATLPLLDVLGIPVRVAHAEDAEFAEDVRWAVVTARERGGPTALVVLARTFEDQATGRGADDQSLPLREDALVAVEETLSPDVAIVATTGKTSRELYELRKRSGGPVREFLTVGSMGHASQIALGIALARPRQAVCVFDGDGSALMHLGSFAVIGHHAPANFRHILFNNHAHESVGGQPTPTAQVDFPALARAAGYAWARSVDTLDDLGAFVRRLEAEDGPALLEVVVRQGSRPDLGRPAEPPAENRRRFAVWLDR